MIEVARVFSGSRAGSKNEIEAKVFADAGRKVGLTRKERLEWALKFAQQSIESMTPGDLYNAQIESGAFVRPEVAAAHKQNRSLPFSPVLFLSIDEIKEVKTKFFTLIEQAANAAEYTFPVTQLRVSMTPQGLSYDVGFELLVPDKRRRAQIEFAMLKLAQLLSEHWGYVGLCDRKRHGCGRYFLKNRTDQQFCSKTCLNRSTTYRQRGKEPVA